VSWAKAYRVPAPLLRSRQTAKEDKKVIDRLEPIVWETNLRRAAKPQLVANASKSRNRPAQGPGSQTVFSIEFRW
jgi:hypothetical protein